MACIISPILYSLSQMELSELTKISQKSRTWIHLAILLMMCLKVIIMAQRMIFIFTQIPIKKVVLNQVGFLIHEVLLLSSVMETPLLKQISNTKLTTRNLSTKFLNGRTWYGMQFFKASRKFLYEKMYFSNHGGMKLV